VKDLVIDRVAGLYRFEHEGKRYAFPSITEVLGATVSWNPWANEEHRIRGSYVHKACAILDGAEDASGLDWDTLFPPYVPYIKAYAKFQKESGFVSMMSEQPVCSMKHRYAGTFDTLGTLPVLRRRKNAVALVERKTGSVEPWTALQLAAQEQACTEYLKMKGPIFRLAVELRADGNYRTEEYQRASDFSVFLALLAGFNWMLENEKLNKGRR